MLKRRLQKTNKDQYILTIPKQLVDLLGLRDKQEILFAFEKGRITLETVKEEQPIEELPRKGKKRKVMHDAYPL